MANRRWNKLAVLFKLETVEGEDATPAAANALIIKNVTFSPIEGEEVQRNLILPYLGNQGSVIAGEYGRIEFDLEIFGSGTAGTVPHCGPVLRSAGMTQTVTAGTSVEYTIIEDSTESASMYFLSDKVQHIFLGGRANIAPSFVPKAYPHFRVSYQGLLGTITDVPSMPVVALPEIGPVLVSKANTVASLHDWPVVAESISLDLGNVLTPSFLIGAESIDISDRSSTGTAVVRGRALSEIDWFALSRGNPRPRGPLSVAHGKVAGNIVTITEPAVEITKVTQGQTNNIINYSLSLAACPLNGLDEMKIAFT